MKILVTGSNGFIGTNLVKFLSNLNHDVYEYDYIPKTVKFGTIVPEVNQYDYVVHLGAISTTTERDVKKVLIQNYDFSKKLLKKCIKGHTNLIYASSASVYGDLDKFKEDGEVYPLNPYAWSKYLFDKKVLSVINKLYIKVYGFRIFNAYGYHEEHKGNQKSVFHTFINQAKKNKEVLPFKNSENYIRDFICVDDICNIFLTFLNDDNIKSGIYNLGTSNPTSFQSIAEYIAKKYNAKVTQIEMPSNLKSQYQKYTSSDGSKLKRVIGNYKFKTPFEWIDQYEIS